MTSVDAHTEREDVVSKGRRRDSRKYRPLTAGQRARLEHDIYLSKVFDLACSKLVDHMKARGEERLWLVYAQKFCEHLIKKTPLSKNHLLDDKTKQLVKEVVQEAKDEVDR